jgi:hypothetical protein
MGPDHPQIEAYLSSKHGVMYSLEGDEWNWSSPTTFTAPVCTTCHMPGGTHNVNFGITIGGTSAGSTLAGSPQPFPMGTIDSATFTTNRNDMISICTQCHSETFASEKLSTADDVKNNTDALAGEARNIIIQLYNDGLLDPMPADRPVNPVTGYNLTLMGHQTYSHTSGIETLFFEMYKYDVVTAWKGAYHFSPDHTHWYGWAAANEKLELIKAEDSRLRALDDIRDSIPTEDNDSTDSSTLTIALGIGVVGLVVAVIALSLTILSRAKKSKDGSPPTS